MGASRYRPDYLAGTVRSPPRSWVWQAVVVTGPDAGNGRGRNAPQRAPFPASSLVHLVA
jgi:hypothetical protein